ncbi:hypothetical protein IG193_00075 [Infirmifilum lucidum]|uniref:Uncharacterized protein n=1 Tax=Infirmifilum lucidum TaxID=2776706 RepID=A0A7L9FGZ4_9CREN|nr:hypothetical protein [Infirmifilum lucidum]QOJ78901.1 hypothetical protein IG193_00075 [Infirmifilum lucidum]
MHSLRLSPEGLRTLSALAGIVLVLVVFAIALQFFYNYQRPHPGADVVSSITSLASEAVYLLGKVAFLGVALLAATQLLKYGLKRGSPGGEA